MREPIRDRGRIEHMLGAIDDACGFMQDVDIDGLRNNKMLSYAVFHSIQIIGEAAYMVTKELKTGHPEVEWRLIEGMRHVLVHDYHSVKVLEVWNIVKNDLPILRKQIEGILSELNKQE